MKRIIVVSLVLLLTIGTFFSMKRVRGMGGGGSGAGSAAGGELPSGGAAAAAAATQASSGGMVKLLTADGQEVDVDQAIAMQFAPVKDLLQAYKTPPSEAIPVSITKKTLDAIIALIEQLNEASADTKRPLDGKFIAQRIQPIIDAQLRSLSDREVSDVILAVEYLNLVLAPVITNGAIRVLVTKLEKGSDLTVGERVNKVLSTINPQWDSKMPQGLGKKLMPIIENQVVLVKDNIPELSIADYIAINGQPEPDQVTMTLDLSRKQITSLDGVDQLGGLFDRLGLYENYITDVPTQAFAGLSKLRILGLGGNKITIIPTRAFAGLLDLDYLFLNNNNIATIQPQAFEGLSSLISLDLAYNEITTLSPQALIGLSRMHKLGLDGNPIIKLMTKEAFKRDMNLPDRVVVDMDMSIVGYIKKYGQPEIINGKLDLSNKYITSLYGLNIVKDITNVKALHLDNNVITKIDAFQFGRLSSLEVLFLNNNGVATIKPYAFEGLSNLQELYLHHNKITTIQNHTFTGLTSLKWLSLSNNHITTILPQVFAGLSNLQGLNLNNNHIFFISEQAFEELSNLYHLNLHNNRIDNILSNTFATLSKLKWLNLRGNPITEIMTEKRFVQDMNLARVGVTW